MAFGEITDLLGYKAKLSDLDLDVDDYVSCSLLTDRKIVINIIDDFLSRLPRNQIRICGSAGFIESSFSTNEIHYWTTQNKRFLPGDKNLVPNYPYMKILEDGIRYDTSMDIKSFKFDINNRYVDEIKYFVEKVIKNEPNISPNLSYGIRVMEILTSKKIRDVSWE